MMSAEAGGRIGMADGSPKPFPALALPRFRFNGCDLSRPLQEDSTPWQWGKVDTSRIKSKPYRRRVASQFEFRVSSLIGCWCPHRIILEADIQRGGGLSPSRPIKPIDCSRYVAGSDIVTRFLTLGRSCILAYQA